MTTSRPDLCAALVEAALSAPSFGVASGECTTLQLPRHPFRAAMLTLPPATGPSNPRGNGDRDVVMMDAPADQAVDMDVEDVDQDVEMCKTRPPYIGFEE